MARDSSDSAGCAGWFKWLVGIVIALLAAGGGIVALLNYFSPPSTPREPPQATQRPQATESPQLWINDIDDNVEKVRVDPDGTEIWNWLITVHYEASSDFFARFEIWAYGPDANNKQKSYRVASSVHKTDKDKVKLPEFWAYVVPGGEFPWRVSDIVHVERFTVRVFSNEDGSLLAERDFMRHPR